MVVDKIAIEGEEVEFVDGKARDDLQLLKERVNKNNENQSKNLEEEVLRAKSAERALEDSKVSVEEGKGLSENDFTSKYKGMLDNPKAMTGATAMTDGAQGEVPKPLKGQEGKFLRGDGTWEKPQDTTYERATRQSDGLMSHEDKDKLDNLDTSKDELTTSRITFNADGSISETLGNGKTKKTVFNSDGSITQTIVNSAGTRISLKTSFNNDGSIERTIV